ncbi:DNA replication/repair protein RecF [Sphingomonas xanthus]|uniref:DNA replication and repair protein RecF n=1 Tax=Sphingomonas xanthus TaxID=2594473 RepID=A0A516IRR6_9SPHN|nr:DNA replication/repair protein RecF [Sphingomonas xanthus]QDP19608.1 DNA replication/repair protein RecF [Sphingomonas xanthus]
MTAVTRLSLSEFRNYRNALVYAAPGFVLLSGPNGAGKTNILEAVSLLAPGRGLRQVPLGEIRRSGSEAGMAVAAKLDDGTEIGTGASATAPDRRQVRINGAAASVNALGERLAILWLTPAMDRLFTDSAGGRRRFLDRLVLALEPGHAHHAARYEAAMRARNKLLGEAHWDTGWLASLEMQMADHGEAVAAARGRTVSALTEMLAHLPDDDFPRASLQLDGWGGADLAATLGAGRGRDAAAGRTLDGPHRQDLAVTHLTKGQPAARGSTGEQKALLLSLVLAHAALVEQRRGAPPVLLLDEVAAHLDPDRRATLYARLAGRSQVWMTATEAALFDGITAATRLRVEDGSISAA